MDQALSGVRIIDMTHKPGGARLHRRFSASSVLT